MAAPPKLHIQWQLLFPSRWAACGPGGLHVSHEQRYLLDQARDLLPAACDPSSCTPAPEAASAAHLLQMGSMFQKRWRVTFWTIKVNHRMTC